MTNEEKAKELAKDYAPAIENLDAKIVIYDAIMEMATWKEQQITEKAVKWWENELTYPTMSAVEIDWLQTKIVAFRKAMKK